MGRELLDSRCGGEAIISEFRKEMSIITYPGLMNISDIGVTDVNGQKSVSITFKNVESRQFAGGDDNWLKSDDRH